MSDLNKSRNDPRPGDWFQTFTGRKIYVEDPRPEDIVILDIAHALSHICRFGGHSIRHYSVAQHSVIVSDLCPPHLALAGLLHDATEAYIGDVIRPLKMALPSYRELEAQWAAAVDEQFSLGGCLIDERPEIKQADVVALYMEKRDLVTPGVAWKRLNANKRALAAAAGGPIHPWESEYAKEMFLRAFRKAGGVQPTPPLKGGR